MRADEKTETEYVSLFDRNPKDVKGRDLLRLYGDVKWDVITCLVLMAILGVSVFALWSTVLVFGYTKLFM